MCLTKKRAVAWIQSFLELVYRQRVFRGLARLTLGKGSFEPSRDGENMRRNGRELILDVIKEDQWPTE